MHQQDLGGLLALATDAQQLEYFRNQGPSTDLFWSRFSNHPAFRGARVLDLGCGHGMMALRAAEEGASVLGIDLDEGRIAFANAYLDEHRDTLEHADRVAFQAVDIADVGPDASFDYVLSKDTFEHIDDVVGVAREIRRLLKPGGELWAGFSPLYASPFGDHGRTGLKVPWAHAVLPKRLVYRSAERTNGHPVRSLGDIGLNGLRARDFLDAFAEAGLETVSLDINRSEKPLIKALDVLRRIPPLERFATVSIYAVLRRPASA